MFVDGLSRYKELFSQTTTSFLSISKIDEKKQRESWSCTKTNWGEELFSNSCSKKQLSQHFSTFL